MRNRRNQQTPLDDARAAFVLERVSEDLTALNAAFYERLADRAVSKADTDRALNLLAERGQIRLVLGAYHVCAVRVSGGEK